MVQVYDVWNSQAYSSVSLKFRRPSTVNKRKQRQSGGVVKTINTGDAQTSTSCRAGFLSYTLRGTMAVLFVGLLASCGSSKGSKTFAEIVGNSAAQMQAVAKVDRERQEEIASCMKRQGFKYDVVSAVPKPSQDPIIGALDPLQENPNDVRMNDLSDGAAYVLALLGKDGRSGCQGVALAKSFGPRDELNQKLGETFKRIDADPRAKSLDQKWSRCMKELGYDVSSPSKIYPSVLLPEFIKLKTSAAGKVFDQANLDRYKSLEVKLSKDSKKCTSVKDAKSKGEVISEYLKRFEAQNAQLLKAIDESEPH
jgi:hypothetical protein